MVSSSEKVQVSKNTQDLQEKSKIGINIKEQKQKHYRKGLIKGELTINMILFHFREVIDHIFSFLSTLSSVCVVLDPQKLLKTFILPQAKPTLKFYIERKIPDAYCQTTRGSLAVKYVYFALLSEHIVNECPCLFSFVDRIKYPLIHLSFSASKIRAIAFSFKVK